MLFAAILYRHRGQVTRCFALNVPGGWFSANRRNGCCGRTRGADDVEYSFTLAASGIVMQSGNRIDTLLSCIKVACQSSRLTGDSSHRPAPVPWVSILVIFLSSRLTIWSAGYLGGRAFGTGLIEPLYLCRHDCLWYMGIVANGYQLAPEGVPPGSANWAFFPLYPLLVRALTAIVLLDPVIAGLLVSNLSFALALCVFYAYYRKTVSDDHRSALYASTLLCYSPGTIYFMAPYTESLFLLLTLLTFHLAASNRWMLAGIASACLTATRMVGVLAIPSMLLIALQKNRVGDLIHSELRCPRLLFALALAPLGLAGFMLFLYLQMGDALAFQHVQVAWGREFGNPFTILWQGLQNRDHAHFWYALVTVLALLATISGVVRRRYAESFLIGAGVLIPLSSFLFSMPRYVFSLFPLYIILGVSFGHNEAGRAGAIGISVAAACIYAIAWALDQGFVC